MQRVWVTLYMVVLVVAGCGSKESKEVSEAEGNRTESGATFSEERSPYVVREAGVRFEPPAHWDPARIALDAKSGTDADALAPGAAHVVSFQYRAEQPGHRDQTLLALMAFPRETWARIAAEPGPPVGAPIDSVDAWVFVASLPQSNPYREGLLDADQFDAMRMTLADVREAFSIEGDGPVDVVMRSAVAKEK